MKVNFDKVKHTAGLLCVAVGPILGNELLPYGKLYAAGAVVGCALLAFLFGAQTKEQLIATTEAQAIDLTKDKLQ